MYRRKSVDTSPSEAVKSKLQVTKRNTHGYCADALCGSSHCCYQIHRFCEYTPNRCENNFDESAADARKQGDMKPFFSVVAGTTNLMANFFFHYKLLDHCRHTVTKHLNDGKTHCAFLASSSMTRFCNVLLSRTRAC